MAIYIEQLICEHDLSQTHSIINAPLTPVCLRQQFVDRGDVSERETRSVLAGELQLPRVRTEHARRYFNYRAVQQWNAAPPDVRDARTTAGCRKRARKWILNQRETI